MSANERNARDIFKPPTLLTTPTHIDEVLFEALAQVLYEGGLAGVVLQQDKVLHAHPVSGCQGRLHHSPHPVTGHHLEEDEQGAGWG